jgi:gluconokinase
VVTCSALRRSYRDLLRTARARVRFVHLTGTRATLGARIGSRTGHFMPPSMLISQLETLEALQPDEDGVVVDIDASREEIVDRALSRLGLAPTE